jgi:hypothetical protein
MFLGIWELIFLIRLSSCIQWLYEIKLKALFMCLNVLSQVSCLLIPFGQIYNACR